MVKLRVIWDVDCVLSDMIPQICKRLKKHYNVDYKPCDIKEWDLAEVTGIKDVSKMLFDQKMFDQQPPIKEAQLYLPQLWKQTYSVLATYGVYNTFNSKAKWIEKHFPFVNVDNELIFIKKKYLLDGDVFIDDNFENAVKWLQRHPSGIAYMLPYAYNDLKTNDDIDLRLTRVKNWKQLRKRIQNLVYFIRDCQGYMTPNTKEDI